jgi:hypothetical protein
MKPFSSGKPRKQFSRPSIDIDSVSRPREYRTVDFHTLQVGDIVPNWGLVTERDDTMKGVVSHRFQSGRVVHTTTQSGITDLEILAFVEKI